MTRLPAAGAPAPPEPARTHRGTIRLEDATVAEVRHHPGGQHELHLVCPPVAERARPGCFVHLRCDRALAMRRPMSVMSVQPGRGSFAILFKVQGAGTAALARRQPGEVLSVLGPIGRPFRLSDYRRHPLLIGGGVGIPPMIFLARHLSTLPAPVEPLVLMGSEIPFPFRPRPSRMMSPGMPDGVIAAMPLLEDWGIASRLASRAGLPGCHDGLVTDLARRWLEDSGVARTDVEIFACGPTAMLAAVAELAREHDLPCEVSLEEYMACAVGGCAGCTVRVRTPRGPAMKRVCVDGPVFDARCVVFPS